MAYSLIGNLSLGGGTDYSGSKKMMTFQSHLWKNDTQWLNENGWKFLRKGLIDADYNPILAMGTSPQSAPTMSATATEPTMSVDTASATQANVAKDMSKSQIMVNKATANKTAEEALTQQNVRHNLDSQALLNFVTSDRIRKLLPLEQQKMLVDIAVGNSVANLNDTTARYIPENTRANVTNANANDFNARNKGYTTTVGLPFGLGSITHTGAPSIITKLSNGKWVDKYEYINGRKVKVKTFIPE